MSIVIQTEKVSKIYDAQGVPVVALKDVDLTIDKGEFMSVVGPSGSGKTTLLNLLGGLDRPSSGRIVIDGRDLGEIKPSRLIEFRLHHVGFVFQAYNLIPVLTALENIEFIMQLQNVPRAERSARALELLNTVGLADQKDRRSSELSGGQQQRVAVARALASLPAYVLADEPTANLDSTSAENLLDIMEKMNRERGMTFLFSTHDPRVVKRAHRVMTLQDGKIVSDAPNRRPAAT
jgi:putative ABC transport system ATP-binding protein